MYKRLSRWARFLEIYMPDGALPVLVGLAMAWQPGADGPFWVRGSAFLSWVFVAIMFIHGSDSIVGYRKGVDQLVYAKNGAVKHEKLLVTGEISYTEALVLTGTVFMALLGFTAFFALNATWPVAAVGVGTMIIASQYSVGLRLSYLGLGELVVASTGLAAPVAHGFVTGQLTSGPMAVGVALGLWHAAANVNSNQADYAYDLEAGRGTLAVRLGLERHRQVGVLLLLAGWAVFAGAVLTGGLPLLSAAVGVLAYRHVQQVRSLFAGNPIEARRIGFGTFRALIWAIILSALLGRALPTLLG